MSETKGCADVRGFGQRFDRLESRLENHLSILTKSVNDMAVIMTRAEERDLNHTSSIERAFAAIDSISDKEEALDGRVQILEKKAPTWDRMSNLAWMVLTSLASIGATGGLVAAYLSYASHTVVIPKEIISSHNAIFLNNLQTGRIACYSKIHTAC